MILLKDALLSLCAMILVILVVSCAQSPMPVQPTPMIQAEELAAEDDMQRITVTGSRISRNDIEAVEPLMVARNTQLGSEQPNIESKNRSWKPSKQSANNAIIKVGENEEISPEALDIKVKIDGFRARILIDGFYKNPHDRNLEGSFKYRLPNGAVPYFFAFGESIGFSTDELIKPVNNASRNSSRISVNPDSIIEQRNRLWNEPKVAKMVPREKAAFAYHDTVARSVDPALVEWSGAGVFSANVFPLFAKKSHRVVLGYDIDLRRDKEQLFLDIPITDSSIPKRIQFEINQKKGVTVAIHRIIDNELRAPYSEIMGSDSIEHSVNGTLINGLRVVINSVERPWLVGDKDGQTYFAKKWTNQLSKEESPSKDKAVFMLDTSLSASPEKFYLWVKLINEILMSNETDLKQFALLSFDVSSNWWKNQFVENNELNRKQLKSYLEKLVLEGATDLAQGLTEATKPHWFTSNDTVNKKVYDLFLLSDGAATWGEKEPYALSNILQDGYIDKVFTYRLDSSGEDTQMLNQLTRKLGGASFFLQGEEAVIEIAKAHRFLPWTINDIKINNGSDVLIAGRPGVLVPEQEITLVGRVNKNEDAEVSLFLSRGSESKEIKLKMDDIINTDLAPRAYGQIAVGEIESLGELERKVATAYANHFRVPGKSSSLLMLESEEDYKRYNIQPQADAFVVQKMSVNSVFTKLSESFAEAFKSHKIQFLTRIEKLEGMSFIGFQMPDAVKVLMTSLPEQAFKLDDKKLHANLLNKKKISKNYLAQLSKQSNQYDALNEEAIRRYNVYGADDALKVMSSLVELAPSNTAILRDVAFAAEKWKVPAQAFKIHKTVMNLRPYEPHSYTYLAKLAAELGNKDLALLYFEMGLASSWQNRFGDYKLIHQIDYANFLREALQNNEEFFSSDYAKVKLKQLKKEVDLNGSDLIVAISWNTDRTDIDLHVVEPSGEECYYSHTKTRSGGFITKDVTQGYGPEMYINSSAPKGRYDLYVNYYRSDENKLGLKTKILVRTIKNFGTTEQEEEVQTVVLSKQKEKFKIKNISI